MEAAHQKVSQMNVGKTNFRKKKSQNEVKEQLAKDENEVKTLTNKMDKALENDNESNLAGEYLCTCVLFQGFDV